MTLDEQLPQQLNSNEKQEEYGLASEYEEYLEELRTSYYASIKVFEFMRNCFITGACNAANLAFCMMAIQLGSGVFIAFSTGLFVGAIPGCLDICSSRILIDEEGVKGLDNPVKIVSGIGKIGSAIFVSYQGVKEYLDIQKIGKESIQAFNQDIKDYEYKPQPHDGLNFNAIFPIVMGCAVLLIVLQIWSKVFSKND